MPAHLQNSALATGLEKVSFHLNPKERQCKGCSNYCTIALISHAHKVMLKILQAGLQQYVNHEIPDIHDGVITHTHLEPDILKCEVKWALGSITTNKASGGDEFQLSFFKY